MLFRCYPVDSSSADPGTSKVRERLQCPIVLMLRRADAPARSSSCVRQTEQRNGAVITVLSAGVGSAVSSRLQDLKEEKLACSRNAFARHLHEAVPAHEAPPAPATDTPAAELPFAMRVLAACESQAYRGYEPEELAIFDRSRPAPRPPEPGFVTDFLNVAPTSPPSGRRCVLIWAANVWTCPSPGTPIMAAIPSSQRPGRRRKKKPRSYKR